MATEALTNMERFKRCIVGDFDNSEQVDAEKKAGEQIHAFARHVNRIADDRIKNKPESINGFFLIEESYYTNPDGSEGIFHHLFLFRETPEKEVELVSYKQPEGLPMEELVNSNEELVFDYNQLEQSPFNPMIYHYNAEKDEFTGKSVNPMPDGKEFTLDEIITEDILVVIECMRVNGEPVNNSDKPILYKRL